MIFLLFCRIDDPLALWTRHVASLSEDILFQQRRLLNNSQLIMTIDEQHNHALYNIEQAMNRVGRSLREFPTMPFPQVDDTMLFQNSLLLEQLN